jgi:DNA-binding transcriptional regulator YhcF (GntR family)
VSLAAANKRKTESDTIPFTHEFLGKMLGVRRATVSQAASKLQAAGLIRTHRGQIKLIKREGLENKACVCYEIVRRHIDRLIPHHPRKKERG